jgi:hypothetical protein
MRWIFSNLPNPSGRTVALGSTQPLTEMSTKNLKNETWGVKGGRRIGLTTLPPSVSRWLRNVGASTSRNLRGLHGLYQGYIFLYPNQIKISFPQKLTGDKIRGMLAALRFKTSYLPVSNVRRER